jgi:hypothetical protein
MPGPAWRTCYAKGSSRDVMPVTKRMMVERVIDAQLASNAAVMCCGTRPGATSMASKRMS